MENIWQPIQLKDQKVILEPLQEMDFEALYQVASDPLIWEQHPNPDRYQRHVFENYFKGAMESGGAMLIRDADDRLVIGCSRFYDYDSGGRSVLIGYTFFARSCWGRGYNPAAKRLMLDYAFQFADQVIFHVGANNIRSQKAMERLGAIKTGELEVAYFGEPSKMNFVYTIQSSRME